MFEQCNPCCAVHVKRIVPVKIIKVFLENQHLFRNVAVHVLRKHTWQWRSQRGDRGAAAVGAPEVASPQECCARSARRMSGPGPQAPAAVPPQAPLGAPAH